MALNFPNVSFLGLSQESRFLGAGFNYSNSKRLSINGNVLDLPAVFGITGIWTGAQGILATVANNQNFQPLILNGYNFGSGRIQNIAFSPGLDVKTKTYTADLIVFDSGDLFNLTGTFYNGINTSGWQYLQTFDEAYSFVRKENGGYGYTHSANIRFNSGVGQLDAISAAKTLAKSLFTGSNLGLAFYSGYTNASGKRFYRETYDLIDQSCGFEETFSFDAYSGGYSITTTNQFELAANGVITVVENGQIRGIVDPTYIAAEAALAGEMGAAYGRCNNVFAIYAPAGSYPLLTTPVVSSRNIDIFQNNLGYSLTFTNDIANSGTFLWDYTQQMTYSEEIARLQENGTVIGRGRNKTEAYNNALAGYSGIKASAYGRATTFYSRWVADNDPAPYHYIETQQVRHSPIKAVIEYGLNFTNEGVIAGTNGVKYINATIQNTDPVYQYGRFGIFNNKEVVQDEKTDTFGGIAISLNLAGERSVSLPTYLTNAQTTFNAILNSGYSAFGTYGYFLTDATYSFNPNANNVAANLRYTFTEPASQTVSVL